MSEALTTAGSGDVVAVVFARGGSKGLPGKNLREFRGQPLTALAVETALSCPSITDVYVSTDDPAIAAVAEGAGAIVPFLRPAELATDEAPEWMAWQHAIRSLREVGIDFQWLVSLPATAPLRAGEDVERCIARAREGSADIVLTVTPAPHNPWFNMVSIDEAGRVRLAAQPPSRVVRRQDAPEVFAIATVAYAARPDFVLSSSGIFDGAVEAVVVPRERAVDIDDEVDLRIASAIDLAHGATAPAVMIGTRPVGGQQPCFVIAEAGVNHNGDLALALELIDAAAAAGADAVKFQTFNPDALASGTAPKAEYQTATGPAGESQVDMLRRLTLPHEAWPVLRDRALARGIVFLSSPFDTGSLEALVELGVPAIKLGSGELTNKPLVVAAAMAGLPLILSTGMADLQEVAHAVRWFDDAGGRGLVLLHCVSMYPSQPETCNLRAISTMADRFGVPVGFSDHTSGNAVAIAAAVLGASVIEKHLTLDRDFPGPDHRASLEPSEFGALVRDIRDTESALGSGEKRPAAGEPAVAAVARRSLVAARDLHAGHALSPDDLQILRPGTGIPPAEIDRVVGSRLRCDVTAGSLLSWADLE